MLEPLALTFGLTAAYDTISKRIPDARLLTARTMTSTAVHILLVAIAQAAVYVYTVNQERFKNLTANRVKRRPEQELYQIIVALNEVRRHFFSIAFEGQTVLNQIKGMVLQYFF